MDKSTQPRLFYFQLKPKVKNGFPWPNKTDCFLPNNAKLKGLYLIPNCQHCWLVATCKHAATSCKNQLLNSPQYHLVNLDLL